MESPLRWVAPKFSEGTGLGNRLFQLAAGHHASKLWGLPLYFAMPYCAPVAHGCWETIFQMFPDIEKLWKADTDVVLSQETMRVFEYTPFPPTPPSDKVLIGGLWIAAAYVRDDFAPNWANAVPDGSTLLNTWGLHSQDLRKNAVAIHVRLGDYCFLPHHQINLLQYYIRCMNEFPENTHFYVFSDEIQKAKSFSVFQGVKCTFIDEQDEVKALYLMANCHGGMIAANSTYSWWGGFFARQLAPEPPKIFMPSRWMASSHNTKDVYPTWATIMDV